MKGYVWYDTLLERRIKFYGKFTGLVRSYLKNAKRRAKKYGPKWTRS